MIITSWIERIGRSLKRDSRRKTEQRRGVASAGERLEERSLLSAQAFFLNGEIDVVLGSNDSVAVTENPVAPGTVQILINGTPALAFPIVSASAVTKVLITGGDDANLIDLTGMTSAVFNNPALSIEAHGGNGADTLLGSDSLADSLDGGHGADSIDGNGLNDTLLGDDGNDTINGGTGDDSIDAGDGQDVVDGNDGNDLIIAGDGQDSATGSAGDDNISGGDGADTLQGGDGDDTLNGGADNDSLDGQNGNDSLVGGASNDTINGGSGNDFADGQGGSDSLTGDAGNDTLLGGNNNDTLLGNDNDDSLNGQGGDDFVIGNDGNDSILGGAGNDAIFGDSDVPLLVGTGDDTLFGNAGNDALVGGGGSDVMDGGVGNDVVRSVLDSVNGVLISIDNAANVIEGSTGQTTNAVFTVSLNTASTQVVTVQFTTADGSAVGTGLTPDYTPVNGTLTFAPGTTAIQVLVPVRGDGTLETDENYFVRLSNATNALITDTEGESFIVNDDGWAAMGPAPVTNAQVTNIVPNNEISGAIQGLATHPTNPDIAYVGTVQGGVWKTVNATAASPTWAPQTDFLSSLSIGDLEFDPADPTGNTLVAGIGVTSSFAATGGNQTGLLRTTDGGTTWTELNTAIIQGQTFRSVAARGTTILAASDDRWSGGGGLGLFRSTDSGSSFTLLSGTPASGLPAGPVSDMVGDPLNLNRFYIAVRQTGVFRSDDAGATWINVTNNITGINNNTTAVFLSVHSTAATNAVYAGVIGANGTFSGLFRSANIGGNWAALDVPNIFPGGQGVVHGAIAADPTNPNLVYASGDRIQNGPFTLDAVRVNASLGAGNQISSIVNAGAQNTAPHADSRRLVFTADGNLLLGGDGGIFRRANPAGNAAWTSMNSNLQTLEAHDAAYDTVSNIVIAAAQDNGTNQQTATGSLTWTQTFGGDGGDVAVDAIQLAAQNRSLRYSSSQNLGGFHNEVYDSTNALISQTFLPLTVTGGGAAIQPQFVTPIATNAVAGNRLIIGAGNATYESLDGGQSVSVIGAGISVNGFGAAPIAYGGSLAGAAVPAVVYVGAGNQVFIRSVQGVPLAASAAAYPGGFVSDIVLDPTNWQIAYVVSQNGVFMTSNGGGAWLSVTGNLMTTQQRTIEFISGANSAIVVGTLQGVFRMAVATPGVWAEFGATSMPNVAIWDLDYDAADDVLLAGTMGRGTWIFANASAGQQTNNPVPGSGGGVVLIDDGDTLNGSDGDDLIIGASGNDIINAGGGNDTALGGDGNDSILGGSGADFLDGQAGDDTLAGQGGKDTLIGGTGNDTFQWNAVSDGDDVVSSVDGFDQMQITATNAADTVSVGKLGPRIQVTSGGNVLTINASIHVVTIDLGAGDDLLTIGDLSGVAQTVLTINGGDGNDTLDASAGVLGNVRLRLNGDAGNDRIFGSSNEDTIDGGVGKDTLLGGNGNDTIFGGADHDAINGGSGDDSMTGDDGNDTLAGGDGNDTLSGGLGNDSLTAQAGNDSLDGAEGRDTLLGGDGNDSLDGGVGKDYLTGGEGNDTLDGGRNDDTILGDAGADTIRGNHGNDSIDAGTGDDTVSGGDGNDTITGGDGNDLMTGADGDDILNGMAGNDTLTGSDGNDVLAGGAGNDIVLGDDGDDTIKGNGGTNTLAGGQGNDSIVGAASEINENFVLSDDLLKKLDLL